MRNIALILRTIGQHYGLDEAQILGQRRTKSVTEARAICVYLIRLTTNLSYERISLIFNRDHSSMVACCKKVIEMPGLRVKAIEIADGCDVDLMTCGQDRRKEEEFMNLRESEKDAA